MTNNISGLRNQEKINARIKVGRGAYVSSTIKGDLYGTAITEYGKETIIILQNVKYVPYLFCKLISLTNIVPKGFKLSGDGNGVHLKKSNVTYNFSKKIESGEGQLLGMKIIKLTDEIAAIGIGSAHAVLGHPSYFFTNSIATKLDMRSVCANEICESCIKGKQQQKNVNKKVEFKALRPGEKIYYDISSIAHKSTGGTKFWIIFVNEHTGFNRSYFLKIKKNSLYVDNSI